MKEMTYEQIIKIYNEAVLGKTNDYYPKLAISYDHDGYPIFFVIGWDDDGVFRVDDKINEKVVASTISYMTGRQFAVTYKEIDGRVLPVFMDLGRRHK